MNILFLDLQNNPAHLLSLKNRVTNAYPEVTLFDICDKESLESSPNQYWNSILVILFDRETVASNSLEEIYETYLRISDRRGHIIPLSCDASVSLPSPMNLIKSIPFHGRDNENIFNMRLGSFLGLRWIPKESDIFISYKVSDGKSIAFQVKEILEEQNFNVWLDENRDDDNEGNIKVGEDCQAVIRENVGRSSLVVLIDTPEAIRSKWVNEEVEFANGSVVPILPFVFRNDGKKGPSFRSLLELQRWLEFSYDPNVPFTFSEDNKKSLCEFVHTYLLEFHGRKKMLPSKISARFSENSFQRRVDELLEKRLCFIFDKAAKWPRTIFTHAFCYPVFFKTAIQVFSSYLAQTPHSPHHYFIVYDGLVWLEEEMDLVRSLIRKDNLRIVHLGELAESIKDT